MSWPFFDQRQALQQIGREFHQRGWSLGTSSNYSVVVKGDLPELLITASGKDKSALAMDDFVLVGPEAQPLGNGQPKPSAETWLHVVLAQQPGIGAILHTHSVWATLLSDWYFSHGGLVIEGYEMLKGLAGIVTHETSVWMEIFENSQDIRSLAEQVRQRLEDLQRPLRYGFLLRRHGLYTWGHDLAEARRHVEILEFLFECVARQHSITIPPVPADSLATA